jgi:2-iminoacetate synthase ThiH
MNEKNNDSDDIEKTLNEAQKRGVDKIKMFLGLDVKEMEKLPRHIVDNIHKQAKIGMDLHREQNIHNRSNDGLSVRIYHLVAEDKKELKELVLSSLPTYLPELEERK